jgi:hypothetical protein
MNAVNNKNNVVPLNKGESSFLAEKYQEVRIQVFCNPI